MRIAGLPFAAVLVTAPALAGPDDAAANHVYAAADFEVARLVPGVEIGYARGPFSARLQLGYIHRGYDDYSEYGTISSASWGWQVGAAVQVFAYPTLRGPFAELGFQHRWFSYTMSYETLVPPPPTSGSIGAWSARVEVGYQLRARNGMFGAIAAGVAHDWPDTSSIADDPYGYAYQVAAWSPVIDVRVGWMR
jgi:hypothetical protein